MPNVNTNGADALIIANVLNTLSAALRNSVAREIASAKVDPLSPTPFTGSASGAIEAALNNASVLSFTEAEVAAVQAAINHATEYENRVQQATGRAVQIMQTLGPLVTKLIPLIV